MNYQLLRYLINKNKEQKKEESKNKIIQYNEKEIKIENKLLLSNIAGESMKIEENQTIKTYSLNYTNNYYNEYNNDYSWVTKNSEEESVFDDFEEAIKYLVEREDAKEIQLIPTEILNGRVSGYNVLMVVDKYY